MQGTSHRRTRLLLAALAVVGLAVPVGAQETDDPANPANPANGDDGGGFDPASVDPSTVDPDDVDFDAPLPDDPVERLIELRRRQIAASIRIGDLGERAIDAEAALDDAEAQVRRQEQIVGLAQARLVQSNLRLSRARALEATAVQQYQDLRTRMAEIAVEAFIMPRDMATLDVLSTTDLATAQKADVFLGARTDRDIEVSRQLVAVGRSLRVFVAEAEELATHTDELARSASLALAELSNAREVQRAIAQQIADDLEATVAVAGDLDGSALAVADAVRRRTSDVLARTFHGSSIPLEQVRGFTVHADIAGVVELLVDHAAADGVDLAGWGYRTTQQQIELRRAHCSREGVSEHDAVYNVPPSECSPPTARPGTSMHELGLAIDFTYEGTVIGSHDSPAFVWLDRYAADYGLANLPSEPWHWSVNGG